MVTYRFYCFFTKQCLVENIQGKFYKNSSATFASGESPEIEENTPNSRNAYQPGAIFWEGQPSVPNQEPAIPIIRQRNGIFTDQSIFRYFSREYGQLHQST